MTFPCARCGGPARRYSRRCRTCDLASYAAPALAFALLAAPAAAQEWRVEPLAGGECFARIVIDNVCRPEGGTGGWRSERDTLWTEAGAVRIEWLISPACGGRNRDPDVFTVLETPEDVVAIPPVVETWEDGRADVVRLCWFRGM